MDDILVIDVQVNPVESRHLLREKAGPSPLHLFQVALGVDGGFSAHDMAVYQSIT